MTIKRYYIVNLRNPIRNIKGNQSSLVVESLSSNLIRALVGS